MDTSKWEENPVPSLLSMNNKMGEKIKILFVCLGNICRSPIAEAVFSKLVKDKDKSSYFLLDSAGTSGYHDGELADPRTRSVAVKNGIEITHRSRKFTLKDFQDFDYILAMDRNNLEVLEQMARNESERAKVILFREFEINATSLEVPDPYYGNLKSFEEVQKIVTDASLAFYDYLRSKYEALT